MWREVGCGEPARRGKAAEGLPLRGERGLSLAGSGQEQLRFGEVSQQRREADVKTQQKR